MTRLGQILAAGILLCGCTRHASHPTPMEERAIAQMVSPPAIAASDNRYAFSVRVLNGETKEPIPNFSAELVGYDPAVTNLINALGDSRGLFHISRNASTEEHSFRAVPLILTAPGFLPQIQMLDLGSDCSEDLCPRLEPTPFRLQPFHPPKNIEAKAHSPRGIQGIINQKGLSQLFKDLMNLGKWDKETQEMLARAPSHHIPQAVVFLHPQTNEEVVTLLGSVLTDIDVKKIGKLAEKWSSNKGSVVELVSTQRELANSLLAVTELLNYLRASSPKLVSPENGFLAKVLSDFLKEKNAESQLAATFFPNRQNAPELAMTTFMPLFQSLVVKGDTRSSTYGALLSEALSDEKTMQVLLGAEKRDRGLSLLIEAAKPLIEAFDFRNREVAEEFNRLVAEKGVRGLVDFGKSNADRAIYSKLAAPLSPLVSVLNGAEGKLVVHALHPVLQRNNPASVLGTMVSKVGSMERTKGETLIAALFPSARDWATSTVPAKRLFAGQLLTGLFSQDFRDVRVVQDLKCTRAVVVTAPARELFKMSLLPNVARIVILKP